MSKITHVRAALAAAIMVAAGATGAMAGKNHVNVHVGDYFDGTFKHGSRHGSHVSINVGSGNGCGYYRERWEDTGSFYWKHKYYDCKGW